MFGLSEC